MLKKVLLTAAVVYTCALIVASLVSVSSIPSLGSSFDDKIYHVLAYILLASLWGGYVKLFNSRKKNAITFVSVFLFGVILELLQHKLNPNRSYDLNDLIANCIGVILGTLFVIKLNIVKLN